jgi:hypothetical protein
MTTQRLSQKDIALHILRMREEATDFTIIEGFLAAMSVGGARVKLSITYPRPKKAPKTARKAAQGAIPCSP